jgi:hypothetical protein
MTAPVPAQRWVEVGADAICDHVRLTLRQYPEQVIYCPGCEAIARTVLTAALPLIDALAASGIRAERQVLTDLHEQVEALSDAAAARELTDSNAYARRVAYDRVLALLERDQS